MDETHWLHRLRETPELLERLEQATGNELHVQRELRKDFPDELVRAAVALRECRRKGARKFSRAGEMWFTLTGLEQSTAEPVARHKAARFAGKGRVIDLCCGIGGDALALTQVAPVTAVDLDPVQLLRCQWNVEAYGGGANLTTRTGEAQSIDVTDAYVHIDPDRRPGPGKRVQRVEEMVPSLEEVLSIMARAKGGAIKLSPAMNFGGKFGDVETELISLDGECKEATIWFGDLATPGQYRATALPSGETLVGHPMDVLTNVGPLQQYLYDPDPAVVRAGLVDVLADKLSLQRLDDAEEYLTGSELVDSPFLQAFEVIAETSNNDREIRKAVREQQWSQLEIKCRHVPIQADEMRKKMPLDGQGAGVLLIARLAGKTRGIVARRP